MQDSGIKLLRFFGFSITDLGIYAFLSYVVVGVYKGLIKLLIGICSTLEFNLDPRLGLNFDFL